MPEYIMFVGLPGTGKSTLIKKLVNAQPDKKYVVISSDDIIEELGREEGLLYAAAFNKYSGVAIKQMNINLENAIRNGRNIIHDQTNINIKARESKLARLTKDYVKKAVVFSITDEELKNRLEKRLKETGKEIPDYVIKNMASKFEAPTKAEGFSTITYIRT